MGRKVRTLKGIELLASKRRSVHCPAYKMRTSAAFLLAMPGFKILWLLKAGLYKYDKKGGKQ